MSADIFMWIRFVLSYRQASIQKKYSLLCSFDEITTFWWNNSQIILKLFENIFEWRWLSYSILHRKTQAMGLSLSMIRVLSKNNDPNPVKRSQIKSIEYIWSFRIDNISHFFFLEKKFFDISKVWFLKFICKMQLPWIVNLNGSSIYWHTKKTAKATSNYVSQYFLLSKRCVSLWSRIENHIHGSDSYKCIYHTSKESIAKNQGYYIKIEQSQQSSVESSNNKKNPGDFSNSLRISKLFHSKCLCNKEYLYIMYLRVKSKKYLTQGPSNYYFSNLSEWWVKYFSPLKSIEIFDNIPENYIYNISHVFVV